MVAHEATGVNVPTGLLTGLRRSLDEVLSIHIVEEDVIALIPMAQHVLQGPWDPPSALGNPGQPPAKHLAANRLPRVANAGHTRAM